MYNKARFTSSSPFNGALYQYSIRLNPVTRREEGVLTLNPLANPENCPEGRILIENGKKLIPGNTPGIRKLMVGVIDQQTALSGFIDPTEECFQSSSSRSSNNNNNNSMNIRNAVLESAKLFGQVTLVGGTYTTEVLPLLVSPSGIPRIIIVSRAQINGTPGHISYEINGTTEPTLTIKSSSHKDTSNVNYFLIE
jgi:hypothetical protein